MASLLIVEDEADLRETLEYFLASQGFEVRGASRGAEALRIVRSAPPDLLLLDLMLPDISGSDVCRQLRSEPRTANLPIVILTARGGEGDRIRGLEMGADDYLVKPFSLRELVLRLQAILRTARGVLSDDLSDDLSAGPIHLDLEGHRVLVEGESVSLSPMELSILKALLERKDLAVSRDELLDVVWIHEEDVSDRAIDTLIRRLRAKLGPAASRIETIRGIGYRILAD